MSAGSTVSSLVLALAVLGAMASPARKPDAGTAADAGYVAESPDAGMAPREWRGQPYMANASPEQTLDVYAPQGPGPHPLVVFIHGGGWTGGDKAQNAPDAAFFVRQGFAFASVNYRLSPAVRHPVHVQDVARAVAFLRSSAPRFNADPERLVLMGFSSGAHLAALLAADPRHLTTVGVRPDVVRGVVLIDGGGYDIPFELHLRPGVRREWRKAFGDDEAVWREASPVTHLRKGRGVPPFLVYVNADHPMRVTAAHRLEARLRAVGARVQLEPVHKDHVELCTELGRVPDGATEVLRGFLGSAAAGAH